MTTLAALARRLAGWQNTAGSGLLTTRSDEPKVATTAQFETTPFKAHVRPHSIFVDSREVRRRLRLAMQVSWLLWAGALLSWLTHTDARIIEHLRANPDLDLLHTFGTWYSNWGLYPFYLTFLVLLVLGHRERRTQWKTLAHAYLLAQAFGTVVLVHLLKLVSNRPRPFEEPFHDTVLSIPHLTHALHSSFPSNHTVDAMVGAVFIAIFWRGRNVSALATLAALLMGVSRVLVGKHYPSDALTGLALAIGIVAVTLHVYLLPRWHAPRFAPDA